MAQLRINFVRKQTSLEESSLWLGGLLLLVGALSLSVAVWIFFEETARHDIAEAAQTALRSRQERLAPREVFSPELNAQMSQAKLVHVQLEQPWEVLFATLEGSRSDDIGLTSLVADADKHDVMLSGEARSFAALGEFSEALSKHPLFSQATPTNHRLSEGAPPIVVRFDLRLRWAHPQGKQL